MTRKHQNIVFPRLSGGHAERVIAALSMVILLSVVSAHGQEMEVPVQVQFALFEKIVSFNRASNAQAEGDFRLGILYQPAVRASSQVAEEGLDVASRLLFNGRKVHVIAIPIAGMGDAEAAITRTDVEALYVAPLRSPNISAIARSSQRHKVLTLTGVPVYVEDGLSVGIALKGSRPQVLINVNASKAEGADFSSQLLRIAKTIP